MNLREIFLDVLLFLVLSTQLFHSYTLELHKDFFQSRCPFCLVRKQTLKKECKQNKTLGIFLFKSVLQKVVIRFFCTVAAYLLLTAMIYDAKNNSTQHEY